MQLDKRDLLTIAVLAVIFFSVATWNLGLAQSPLTTWQTSENKSFYIDLGRNENIGAVYFLVQRGNVTVRVYTGSPGNWSYSRATTFDAYNLWYNWQKLDVNSNTQYLQFDIQPGLYDSRPQFYWSVPSPSDALPHPFIELSRLPSSTRITSKSQSTQLQAKTFLTRICQSWLMNRLWCNVLPHIFQKHISTSFISLGLRKIT